MKNILFISLAICVVFQLYNCEQITSNSTEQQVKVKTGPESLAIHNNMSVPVYYLVIERERAARALPVFRCSPDNVFESGQVREILYSDIVNYKPGGTILVHAWQCNIREKPEDLTIFKVETP